MFRDLVRPRSCIYILFLFFLSQPQVSGQGSPASQNDLPSGKPRFRGGHNGSHWRSKEQRAEKYFFSFGFVMFLSVHLRFKDLSQSCLYQAWANYSLVPICSLFNSLLSSLPNKIDIKVRVFHISHNIFSCMRTLLLCQILEPILAHWTHLFYTQGLDPRSSLCRNPPLT